MIDTHCHLDVPRFDGDRAAVLERAWAAGVQGLVVPAIGPDAWEPLLEWPSRDARVQVALGIHPQLLPHLPEADDEAHLARLGELLARGVARAVGECGLDGPSQAGAPFARQERVLAHHLELARRHGLPAIVHCFHAHPQLQRLLAVEAPVPRGLVMHSYSGSADLVRVYLRHGAWFSFAGPVTFTEARRPLDALRAVPLERLLVETDAPDQAPHPHRGQRSEPAYLGLMVAAMAKARGEPEEVLADALARNARTVFGEFTPGELR